MDMADGTQKNREVQDGMNYGQSNTKRFSI